MLASLLQKNHFSVVLDYFELYRIDAWSLVVKAIEQKGRFTESIVIFSTLDYMFQNLKISLIFFNFKWKLY